ncbi:MAG: hypothetical protein COB02_03395 [Candidatus Cloacimonadota bacterium]|nr:MAG: hypothetical protein COB02_03395 [Candidatus Cloacimonadota bacterium]
MSVKKKSLHQILKPRGLKKSTFLHPMTLESLQFEYKKGNSHSLLKLASNVQIENPNSIIARVYTARALFLSKNPSQASDLLETVVIPFPKLKAIYLEYLTYLYEAKSYSMWEVQCNRFFSFHYSKKLAFCLGKYLVKEKNYKQALSLFLRLKMECIEENEAAQKVVNILGVIYFRLGYFKEAKIYLDKSSSVSRHYYLAEITKDQGKLGLSLLHIEKLKGFTKSKKLLSKAISLAKGMNNFSLEMNYHFQMLKLLKGAAEKRKSLHRMLFISKKLGDCSLQEQILKSVLKMSPTNINVLKDLSNLYKLRKMFKKSFNLELKIIKLSPLDQEIRESIAKYYYDQERYDKSYHFLKLGYISSENSFEMNLWYGESAYYLQKWVEAREVFLSLVSEKKSLARIYFLLAKIYSVQEKPKLSKYYQVLFEEYNLKICG